MLRIACIDNLSGLAYRMIVPEFPAVVTAHTPTEICERVNADRCDAALLPVACLETMRTPMVPLGEYGIAVQGRVQSVVVLSQRPLHRLVGENQPIAITGASQTSRRLLRILCWRAFGREPMYVDEQFHAPARLLIGDAAIATAGTRLWPVVTDLGLWWFAQTGLPFVFARWMVRSDCSASNRDALLEWLESCARYAESPPGRATMTETLKEMPLGRDDAERYYQQLRVRLGEDELVGLATFRQFDREMMPCACNA